MYWKKLQPILGKRDYISKGSKGSKGVRRAKGTISPFDSFVPFGSFGMFMVMDIDYQKKSEEMIVWMQKTVYDAGFAKVVVAVSGGVDSAVSVYLAVRALGEENVYALLMPYGKLGTKALADGRAVASAAGLDREHIVVKDIKKVTDKLWSVISKGPERSSQEISLLRQLQDRNDKEEDLDNVRRGNIMARMRMIFLYDLAKSHNALVVGTENKSEHYLGYFTRFGDEASDIEPIRSLYKTQIWEMARFLEVPHQIIEKAPSANLWEGQSDEGEFGFSYLDADKVLYYHFEEGLQKEEIVALGLSEQVVDAVLKYVEKNDFKHKVPFIFDKND